MPIRNSFLLNNSPHFCQVRRVASHISRQYYPHKALSKGLKVISGEFFQEIVLRLVENGERFGRVEVFLDRLVAVADGSLGNLVHVVGICKAIVSKIMAYRAHAKRQGI